MLSCVLRTRGRSGLVTVDVGSVDCIADEGLVGAAVDFDVALSDGFQNAAGVEGGLFEGRVAVHGGYTQEFDWQSG